MATQTTKGRIDFGKSDVKPKVEEKALGKDIFREVVAL